MMSYKCHPWFSEWDLEGREVKGESETTSEITNIAQAMKEEEVRLVKEIGSDFVF